jgi:hypothetical protein
VFETQFFAGLDRTDRQVLDTWFRAARCKGIDTMIDLADRPWGAAGLEVVIGVFRRGEPAASWLLIRYQHRWVVVTVPGAQVSAVLDTLPDALRLIDGDTPT